MSKDIFPQTPADLAAARKKLAPHIHLSAIRSRSSKFIAVQNVCGAVDCQQSLNDGGLRSRALVPTQCN